MLYNNLDMAVFKAKTIHNVKCAVQHTVAYLEKGILYILYYKNLPHAVQDFHHALILRVSLVLFSFTCTRPIATFTFLILRLLEGKESIYILIKLDC